MQVFLSFFVLVTTKKSFPAFFYRPTGGKGTKKRREVLLTRDVVLATQNDGKLSPDDAMKFTNLFLFIQMAE